MASMTEILTKKFRMWLHTSVYRKHSIFRKHCRYFRTELIESSSTEQQNNLSHINISIIYLIFGVSFRYCTKDYRSRY